MAHATNADLLNQRDGGQGYAPLHWATISNRPEIAKYLIAQGADVNVKANYNYTPLHFAAMNRNRELIQALLDKKAEVNAQDNQGFTPLMHAMQYGAGDLGNVELLIKAGTDVNLGTQYKYTPLHMACQYTNEKLVLMLLEGMFGHNLLRFNWLWYIGFLVIAGRALKRVQAENWAAWPAVGVAAS